MCVVVGVYAPGGEIGDVNILRLGDIDEIHYSQDVGLHDFAFVRLAPIHVRPTGETCGVEYVRWLTSIDVVFYGSSIL